MVEFRFFGLCSVPFRNGGDSLSVSPSTCLLEEHVVPMEDGAWHGNETANRGIVA